MRINKEEHLKHAWRVHRLLPDLRIEDVWDLPVELDTDQYIGELNASFVQALEATTSSGLAGWLFRLRFFIGKVLGWEDTPKTKETMPAGSIRKRYANQEGLSTLDVEYTGFADFVPVYDLKEEMLSEIENVTVLAAVHFGRVLKENGQYGVQMTVYVKPKGLFGEVYMQLIKPFRLLIVYPVMLKLIGRQWEKFQQRKVSGQQSVN
ncbi:MAG: DUF2867 domain-containing protein [Imperialibacter sp.]|uniref:DUF2867 domain-containing protein n=1 Tax=Imperialibacter sp. TaxID=2038411 RepID=UPI0032F029CF